jgi:magnesium transporter
MVSGKIAFGETHLFIGRGYVVSVRHGASSSYSTVREHCESCPKMLSNGEDYILYKILDFVVDNYQPVVEAVRKEVEELEDRVLHETTSTRQVQRLYALRRELLKLRNAVVPLVDICRRLEHAELLPIDAEMRSHFRDVTDHVQRIREGIDSLREVLAFAFEASLMMGQAQQSAITRKLAAWAAILAVPTALAGIYGMNFDNMPELKWQYGYFAVVAIILALCGFLFYRFKRNDWL